MPNTNIKDRHEVIIHLAEILHRWFCREDHGNSYGDTSCSWAQEPWEPLAGSHTKQLYWDKAAKVYDFYDDPDECLKFLKFLQIVNPHLCLQLIDEL